MGVNISGLVIVQQCANIRVALSGQGKPGSDEHSVPIERAKSDRPPLDHRRQDIVHRFGARGVPANVNGVGHSERPRHIVRHVVDKDQFLAASRIFERNPARKAGVIGSNDAARGFVIEGGLRRIEQVQIGGRVEPLNTIGHGHSPLLSLPPYGSKDGDASGGLRSNRCGEQARLPRRDGPPIEPLMARDRSANGWTLSEGEQGLGDVQALLALHFGEMRASSPRDACHVLSPERLSDPHIRFVSLRDSTGQLLGIGALKTIANDHGELKSMRTDRSALGQGVGQAMLDYLLDAARDIGLRRVSLETGNSALFDAANRLYEKSGFIRCGPFGGYLETDFTHFYTLAL